MPSELLKCDIEADCELDSKQVTVQVKTSCYDERPQDRYKIIYSYPIEQLPLVLKNAVNDSVSIVSGNNSFVTENYTVNRNGVAFTTNQGDQFFFNSDTQTLTLNGNELSRNDLIIEAILTGYFWEYINNGLTYDITFNLVDELTIQILQNGGVINTVTINTITGNVIIS